MTVVVVLELDRRDHAEFAVEAAMVEPVDVPHGRDLDVLDAAPRLLVAVQLGLEDRRKCAKVDWVQQAEIDAGTGIHQLVQPGRNAFYSMSWGHQPENYNFQLSRGAVSVSRSSVKPGYIAYVAFKGGGKSGIDHAAIVTKVTAGNVYVSQHSKNKTNEPVHGRGQTWAGLGPLLGEPVWDLT